MPHWYAAAQCTLIDILLVVSTLYFVAPKWMSNWFEVKEDWFSNFMLTIPFFALNYFLFVHKNRYRSVIKPFEGESKKKEIIGNVAIILFCIALIWVAVEIQSMQ